MPVLRDKLTKYVKGDTISTAPSLRNLAGILSSPVDFDELSVVNSLKTSSSVVI
jgi:hypothetical protein